MRIPERLETYLKIVEDLLGIVNITRAAGIERHLEGGNFGGKARRASQAQARGRRQVSSRSPQAKMVVKVDDTVLAYHGVMIYDAKVLKVDHGQGVQSDKHAAAAKGTSASMYYVHYQGWHKKWDEWIAHDRVLEDTPANRALQRKAKADFDAKKKDKSAMAKKKKISASGIESGAAKKSPFKRMKRNTDNDTEEMPTPLDAAAEGAPGVKQIAIQMPFSLKKQLVEDWKHVTHEPYRLVSLPRKPNVRQIIQNYLESKRSKLKEGVPADDKEYKVCMCAVCCKCKRKCKVLTCGDAGRTWRGSWRASRRISIARSAPSCSTAWSASSTTTSSRSTRTRSSRRSTAPNTLSASLVRACSLC